MISYIMKKIVGSKNQRQLKKLQTVVESSNEYEQQLAELPISDLSKKSDEIKSRIKEAINNINKIEIDFSFFIIIILKLVV